MKNKIILLLLFAGLIVTTVVVRAITLEGAQVVRLQSAPPLTGVVSQALVSSRSDHKLPIGGKDYNLRDVKYFSGGSWVVATIVPTNDTADSSLIALHKVDGDYEAALGPGTSFSNSVLQDLPNDVGQYLNQKGVLYVPTLP
jgi:hypothetical protein